MKQLFPLQQISITEMKETKIPKITVHEITDPIAISPGERIQFQGGLRGLRKMESVNI